MRPSLVSLPVLAGLLLAQPVLAHADDAPVAVPAPPPPAPVYAARPSRSVWVHVNADRPVTLEALAPDESRWLRLCVAPCDTEVPLDAAFRVVDHGMMSSRVVELEASPGDRVVLDVNVRTNAEHETGEGLRIAGWIAAGVGLALEATALAVDPSSAAQPYLEWGGIGAAAATIALAISAYVTLQPSGLSQSSATPAPARAARGPSPWTRLPSWREAEGVVAPKPTTVPLFSATF